LAAVPFLLLLRRPAKVAKGPAIAID